ncbi:MAG: D-3-phosphoglycerate dehydrogenase [Planctomycetes bacterium]|nr:D-3-phosphoglycerate dehydrogenase [Planctomycetota bacterium]MCQ3948976.1 phosphoglycerate dehydrogenase [Planctomycetota bacterium]GIK52492.1 MAG: D-3-phosphoglycerate dehydrogenase [Planctomycetota bacterium]HRJ78579.1 phosphoglycerate dehydrogenase [Planctomycetota bacterium]
MAYRIFVSAALDRGGLDLLRQQPQFDVVVSEPLNGEALAKALAGADAVIVRSESKLTRQVLEHTRGLRVIGRAGSGVDNIDVEAATSRGIAVLNAPGGNTVTAAEHTLALMFALARHVPQANARLAQGVFDRKSFVGVELSGKTLGIVGLGQIGAVVAERARGLHMQVLAFDPFVTEERARALGLKLASLDEVIAASDFLTVHTPLNEKTRGIIGRRAFELAKHGVRVINCARGGLIDEAALLEALNSGKCAGAALDVFEQEPPAGDHPLVRHPRVVCTPHLGASTVDAQEHVAEIICKAVSDYLLTGAISGAVNLPSLSAERFAQIKPWLTLARRFGEVLAATCDNALDQVALSYDGEVARFETGMLSRALMAGLLSRETDSANLINALDVARRRGISVTEQRCDTPRDFASSISVRLGQGQASLEATATLYGNNDPRIVSFGGVRVEALLEGHMLWLTNNDKPGVIGRIGTLVGESGVNIARFHLGRGQSRERALAVVAVDSAPSQELVARLRALQDVNSVHAVDLTRA